MELDDISMTQMKKDRQHAHDRGTVITDPVMFRRSNIESSWEGAFWMGMSLLAGFLVGAIV